MAELATSLMTGTALFAGDMSGGCFNTRAMTDDALWFKVELAKISTQQASLKLSSESGPCGQLH